VLLCPEGAAPLSLRGTGIALWETLDPPRSVREIAALLSREFGAAEESVRSDVELTITRLAEAGALRRVA
jgi:hypothetical protein